MPSNFKEGSSTGTLPVARSTFLRFKALLRAALVRDFDRVGIDQLSESLHHLDLVFLHQVGDATGQLADDLALPLHHGGEIDLDFAGDQAVGGKAFPREMQVLRGSEKSLAGNATHVEAGAAKRLIFLYNGRLEAQLGGADGGDITAGTAANDNKLVIEIGHEKA